MGIRDRLRRLEYHFGDRGPSPEEVSAAFELLGKDARAKLHGKRLDEKQHRQAKNAIEQWKSAKGIDLSQEAERAHEKLEDMGRGSTDDEP